MRKVLLGLALLLGSAFLTVDSAYTAEEKPLGPGWLSLDSSVGILDNSIARGKGGLQDTLGINIDGYLDTGYNWSSNHPRRPANISLRYFDKDHDKIVFNDFHIALDKPEKDWGVGFHISGDFGRTGELLREATFWGKALHHEPSAELREAYLTTTLPVGEGLAIKGGLFVTPLGTEIIPSPGAYNDNISRSFLFNLAIPFRHLGVTLSYPVLKILNVSAGVVTGWDDPRDNNHSPSFLGGITLTPTETISFASNLIAGEEPTFTGPNPKRNTARFTWSNVLTVKPFDPLAVSLEYTRGHQNKGSLGGTRDATWQGVAGIASFGWTDRFTTALRAEFFNDRDGARTLGNLFGTHANVKVAEATLTGSYKFTKMFLGRAEVRQDWANTRVYKRRASNADKDQTTLAMQLIYTY
jgi:hypothetical protein